MDEVLATCNETEMLAICWRRGQGRLRRGIPHQELFDIVRGETVPQPHHMAGTGYTRNALQNFISHPDNWPIVRSQLPGCDGCCRTFNCSEIKHVMCLTPNENSV